MLLHIFSSWSYIIILRILICPLLDNVLTTAQRLKPLLRSREELRTWTLKLNKQSVPVVRKGAIVAYKTAYFGTVYVGTPEPSPFKVLFDTGSAHVFLPSVACLSDVCVKRSRYAANQSGMVQRYDLAINESRLDVESNATQRIEVELLYGTGSVTGEFVQDRICVGGPPTIDNLKSTRNGCIQLGLLSAYDLTTEPFDQFSFDGVVGLGLDGLALRKDFSFFESFTRQGNLPEPCFSIFLANGNDTYSSDITFGGHIQDHAASHFKWASVASPEQGYWQVALTGVYVGDKPLSRCADGSCRAVLDSGTSLLGIPQEAISSLHRLLARPVDAPDKNCRAVPGPPIIFDFGNFTLQLEAEDYTRPAAMMVKSKTSNTTFSVCRASLLPVPANVDTKGGKMFILGEPFLQRHYTKYNWQKREIGFALARQHQEDHLQM